MQAIKKWIFYDVDVDTNRFCNSSVIVNNNSEQIIDQSKRLGYDDRKS